MRAAGEPGRTGMGGIKTSATDCAHKAVYSQPAILRSASNFSGLVSINIERQQNTLTSDVDITV
jgi:hypothetical protein